MAAELILKTPAEWAAELGVEIRDPDGWRTGSKLGAKSWDEPLSEDEFRQRLAGCTRNLGITPKAEHLLPESIRQELAEIAADTGFITSGRAADRVHGETS